MRSDTQTNRQTDQRLLLYISVGGGDGVWRCPGRPVWDGDG